MLLDDQERERISSLPFDADDAPAIDVDALDGEAIVQLARSRD